MSEEELLNNLLIKAGNGALSERDADVLEMLLEDRRKSNELEETKDDNKKRRIGDWVRWALGGLAGGCLAWMTFYYEDNSFVSGSRGKVLGKLVDKAIFRKN